MPKLYEPASPWDQLKTKVIHSSSRWICRCGTGHFGHEEKCVKCGTPRQVWPEEETVQESQVADSIAA
jgi:hypothetical protein